MKIGIAQLNPVVGDIAGNCEKIAAAYKQLCADGAELVIFPEMIVCGYPPRDLLFKSRFVPDVEAATTALATMTGIIPAVIGFVERNESGKGRPFYNAAAWCSAGKIQAVARKCLLPTYDVFDEDRYFQPASQPTIIEYQGRKIGLTICEDIWTAPATHLRELYPNDPIETLAASAIDLLLNLSASPWHRGKEASRMEIIRNTARRCGCPTFYCNAIGGNDELIFDGHSMAVREDGEIMGALSGFKEELAVIDTAASESINQSTLLADPNADIHEALVLGLRDYAFKSGFKTAIIGLSGGVDSALVAVLAAEAFGPENVIGVSLPSAISSDHSKNDAVALAENLGIRFHTVEIAEGVASAETALADVFNGLPRDVTEENIQARMRGLLLMAMSNKFNALLLTTGNKSEIAVGYCTLYGDMCGGLAVISDLPKMGVYSLCEWINREKEIIPRNTLDKAPSAELRPGQTDQDSLPPYPVLDEILRLYVEEGLSRAAIVEAGFESTVVNEVCRKVDLNEYKRKQAAPGLKITPLAFGVGRRIPIVQKYVN